MATEALRDGPHAWSAHLVPGPWICQVPRMNKPSPCHQGIPSHEDRPTAMYCRPCTH